MEDRLTVADLARFLRARKSANCKIGADFCEEYPEHPEVVRCLGWLDAWVKGTAYGTVFLTEGYSYRNRAALHAFDSRFAAPVQLPPKWTAMVSLCHARLDSLSGGWAGRIIQRLQPRSGSGSGSGKKGVRVQFLLLVEVTLDKPGATDDQLIQQARRKLPKKERENAHQVRVVRSGTEEFRYLTMSETEAWGD